MLPEVLSNGLCSLNPQVDRLCMVCEMTISSKGRLTGFKFYEAVMSSRPSDLHQGMAYAAGRSGYASTCAVGEAY